MSPNYFEFFKLPQQYPIDLAVLEANFRKIQTEVHPDKFVTASPAERLQSMQTATLANEAFHTLKHPTLRARYLLQLHGIESLEDNNTAMPADFLMMQMEWREHIEDATIAKDISMLESQLNEMKLYSKTLQNDLTIALSHQETFNEASNIVRKLTFIDKVSVDVNNIIAKLED